MANRTLREIFTRLTLVGLVPMALMLAFLTYKGYELTARHAQEDLMGLTRTVSTQFRQAFALVDTSFQELSTVEALRSGDAADCKAWLVNYLRNRSEIDGIYRASLEGTATCSNLEYEPPKVFDFSFDRANPALYREMRMTPVRTSGLTGKKIIGFAKAFENSGAPFGLVLALSKDWFEARADEYARQSGLRYFILNNNGQIILQHPPQVGEQRDKVPTFSGAQSPDESVLIHEVANGIEGTPRLLSTTRVHQFEDGEELYLSISVDKAGVYAAANDFVFMGLLVFALGCLGIFVTSQLAFSVYFSRPVSAIVDFAKEAAGKSGNLPDLELGNTANDLRELGQAVATMATENESHAASLNEALSNLTRAEQIAHMGHWRIDLRAQKLFWSDGVYAIHGLSPDSFEPDLERAIELYHPDDRDSVQTAVDETLRNHQPFEFEKRIVRPDGTSVYVFSRGEVMLARDGTPLSLFGVFLDIDTRKRAERNLKRAQRAAEDLADARALFTATVSHEVRTPLNAMLGVLDAFRQDTITPKQAEHLALLDASGQMMLNVVNDVLDATTADTGEVQLVEEALDIKALLEGCVDLFRNTNSNDSVDVSVKFDPTLPTYLVLDGQRLQQMLFNLIGNALKHTHEGEVAIHAKVKGERLVLTVQDTGTGIAEEDLPRLFEKFRQAENSTSKKARGSGLGLYVVKLLADRMGGRVAVKSRLGEGSCFTLTLPFKTASTETLDSIQTDARTCVADTSEFRILVVEDNPLNRKLIESVLKKLGCTPILANDGQYAVDWLMQNSANMPDLILADINMPRLSGFELVEFVREQLLGGAELPIIMVSADVVSDYADEMKRHNVSSYIAKPIDILQLEAALAPFRRPIQMRA